MRRRVILVAVLLAAAFFARPALKASAPYIGAESCRSCHPGQYEAWKKGPHASAFFRLDLSRREDPRCVRCHATDSRGGMDAIECESCHGPGGHYSKSFIMKDLELAKAVGLRPRDYETCLLCHEGDMPTVRSFDAARDWKRLPHSETASRKKP